MTEVRRIKLKFGDAEFEADVREDEVQPMYDQFLCTLERRIGPRADGGSGKVIKTQPGKSWIVEGIPGADSADQTLLMRIFDVRKDGGICLKVLPRGDDKDAEALLLILYGYRRLKNEDGVLATRLHRDAEHSGISIRWPAYELANYDRYVERIGHKKGSIYSLNTQGVAMAQEITTRIFEYQVDS